MTPRSHTVLPSRSRSSITAVLAASLLALSGCASDDTSRPERDPQEASRVDAALGGPTAASTTVRPTPVVLSEEEWSFSGRDGWVIRTPHYRLFTTESDEVLRERMPIFLEYAIAHYRSAITELPLPSQKLDTYLMDNRPQWETLTKRLLGEQGAPLEQIQRGGYASRGLGVYFDIGLYDTLAIAAHEGWHQYTQRTFQDPLPLWLEEGLATYMEGHSWSGGVPVFRSWQNLERYDALRRTLDAGRLMSVETLMSESPLALLSGDSNGVLAYYAQVWALTHFLTHGEDGKYAVGLGLLLQDAADGTLTGRLVSVIGQRDAATAIGSRLGDGVARAYFGVSGADLDASYRAFVADITSAGDRDRVTLGLSPL